ncbi:hypothetical protein JOF29_006126 [Kribbella aluminosa]|uniref:Uncharacterized protein n=1 Tax=Kribbella aluminosa TaxID=416017 RepID=A0ABS4UTX9_9ACTN|nr:hypothetical protein [Kribbella aluminosa]MBP2355016.1 hypothetical protein [Kribbella aluminosa]
MGTRSGQEQPADQAEPAYGFRRRLETVHRTDRRDPAANARGDEVVIDDRWRIVLRPDAGAVVRHAAADLSDYFSASMDLRLPIVEEAVTDGRAEAAGGPAIFVATASDIPGLLPAGIADRGYTVTIEPQRIVVCGATDRGAAQACYHLEDCMNLRGAPFLSPGTQTREPLFEPRMTHSGWGLDSFPDAYLNQIAHAGMDSILVFATGPDRTPDAFTHRQPSRHSPGQLCDFNELVDRCAGFGLDVYLYAYFHGARPVHPDDPEADAFFDRTYGALFEACPRAKGIVLVGESVEFPSLDPRTNGRLRLDPAPDGLPSDKPLPGWWPCADFPQWVTKVRDACRRYNAEAEVIFWTYNWGWAPEEDRLRLVESLPKDVVLQATFEMFEPVEHDGVRSVCVDYTASFVGPGRYFASEAAAANRRGMPLYSMVNTGGLTWDLGVVPYQPIPQRWSERHSAVLAAKRDWGLTGLMENHHYGWWPSFVSELAKWAYWAPSPDPEDLLAAIASRDFGAAAEDALAGWRLWSEAAGDHVPSDGDQYGPLRIGPAYPLTLFSRPALPVSDDAMFGDLIVQIPYEPDHHNTVPATANARRIRAEITALERMIGRWDAGVSCVDRAAAAAPAYRQEAAAELAGLGRFIGCCLRTALHTKQWWLLKAQLLVTADTAAAEALVAALCAVGEAEVANAEAAIPLVEADSRLGWEPSMEYIGDADHIRWKLAHLRHALDLEVPAYRTTLHI